MVDDPAPAAAAAPDASREAAQWVPATEAARQLAIQERSLYAYVSRGLIRSVPGPSGRQRLYSAEDLTRLRARRDARSGHAAVAASALSFGEAVLDSSLTEITPAGPSYRGYLACELAARAVPFENVAELLWSGALVDGAVAWPAPPPALPWALPGARAAARPGARTGSRTAAPPVADALIALTLARAARDPERDDPRPDVMARAGRRLIPELAACSNPHASPADLARAAAPELSIAARIAAAWRLPAKALAAIDAALVVIADHELNASTFAARVAAGTGADPYAVIIAALSAFSGPRHGTASLEAGRFLAEVAHPSAAPAAVRALRERYQLPPGFGHRAYQGPDPRAAPLFELAEQLAPAHPLVKTARAVIAAVAKDGAHPNVDFGQVTLAAAIGAPVEATAAWFAVGRCAGWLAHAAEQRTTGALLRPRARYTGPAQRPLAYTPAAPRSPSSSARPRPQPARRPRQTK